MKKERFDQGWSYCHLDVQEPLTAVSIPHDAMFCEPRLPGNPGGGDVCWFAGRDYRYVKRFSVPQDWAGKHIVLEFEGVYRHAEVFLNDQKAGECAYGYTGFYVVADEYLLPGAENTLEVRVHNSQQPNSRWYSGAGIYRPVNLYMSGKSYIQPAGVRIRTVSLNPAVLQITANVVGQGTARISLLYQDEPVLTADALAEGSRISLSLTLPEAKLWSPDTPNLYRCRIAFSGDIHEEVFGVRILAWNRREGFTINGKRTILRGACIHHDNGLLGACCHADAEERKIRILKENGYNAIRSAHNPCSKALLDACDRLGVLVMDEFVDCWYIHKTKYDYVNDFEANWQFELTSMVAKDYNHPSVVMYSTGNEVSETAQEKGIALTGEMTRFLHRLDDTRPVTCGVNIFFNFLSSIGFGVYSDDKAEKTADQRTAPKKKKPVGSEFFNTLATLLGDTAMKVGATFYGCDVKTRGAFAQMDIAGYNYGILRYKHDLKKYPDRLIVGSETFCKDAYRFYEQAKQEPGLIGDFVWAGMDYLGEVSAQTWAYQDEIPEEPDTAGFLCSESGRIGLTGIPIGESAYTKVAFEQTAGPLIAVVPVCHTGKRTLSAWKLTNARSTWAWNGWEGSPATVEVYARAAEVELLVNGTSVGRKRLKKDCRAVFQTTYQAGTVTAVSYDARGREIGRSSLRSAGAETELRALPEQKSTSAGHLVYVNLQYTDENGLLKPAELHTLTVSVTGGKLLAFGNANPYQAESPLTNRSEVYYGAAQAIILAEEPGMIHITASDGVLTTEASILVR